MEGALDRERTSLVLPRGLTPGRIEELLTRLGLRPEPSTAVTAAVLPGEPELLSWRREDGTRAVYTFQPVVGLRVLSVHGPNRAELTAELAELPALRADDVLALLADPQPESILCGILAAEEL